MKNLCESANNGSEGTYDVLHFSTFVVRMFLFFDAFSSRVEIRVHHREVELVLPQRGRTDEVRGHQHVSPLDCHAQLSFNWRRVFT